VDVPATLEGGGASNRDFDCVVGPWIADGGRTWVQIATAG
jgi:hypothetical protein